MVFPVMQSGDCKHSIERNTIIVYNFFKKANLKLKNHYSYINPADAKSAYDGLVERKDEYLGVIMDWSLV